VVEREVNNGTHLQRAPVPRSRYVLNMVATKEMESNEMNPTLRGLPIEQRIRLVEDLWDSIAADQGALLLTDEQRAELDRRLGAYEADGNPGRPANEAISDIRRSLCPKR
jgi:putative addiction module component (TIGR02574 family)